MITTRRMSLELEFVRWLLLVIAAIALLLAIATAVAAAKPVSEPRLLPANAAQIAKPMGEEMLAPFFPEYPPGRVLPLSEAAARLWMTLESHRAGCTAEAVAGWEQIRLPGETAHWREVGLAAAYLQAGDLRRAELYLDRARQLAPDNAVVAYFTGLLYLEKAAAWQRVPDGLPRSSERLVAFVTPADDRLQLQLLAAVELRRAIATAAEVRLDEWLLLPDPEVNESIFVPRVGDLLVALGADNFLGKAHHLLFGLYLRGGELAVAEQHLDQAAATGIATLYGYRDLAEMCLEQGEYAALPRLAAKELRANHPEIARLGRRLCELTGDVTAGIRP
jgi:tetratricopeptide (TPR) repeat protein